MCKGEGKRFEGEFEGESGKFQGEEEKAGIPFTPLSQLIYLEISSHLFST